MGRTFVIAVMLSLSLPGHGQQPTSAFQACLADNTSGRDRKDLAKWIFFAIAAHPEMREHVGPNTVKAADESSRRLAALVVRLLADDCLKETKAVIQGGPVTQSFQVAFSHLGELAMQELTTDKAVAAAMGDFEQYLDKKRLEEALIGK